MTIHNPSLSVCFIVKNEEENIERALHSIKDIADEIIIVDTGSCDRTMEICRSFQKVIPKEFVWCHDFAKARNYSVEWATKDWILVLDADEEIAEPVKFHKLLENPAIDGYSVLVRNLQPKGSLLPIEDGYAVRLFRNKKEYRYEGIIHEQIVPSIVKNNGKIVQSNQMILHYGYQMDRVQGEQSRKTRNLHLLQAQLRQTPSDCYYWFQMGKALQVVNPKKALFCLDKSIRLGAERQLSTRLYIELLYRKMQLVMAQKKDKQAYQLAEDILARNPHHLSVHMAKVSVTIALQKWEEAKESIAFVLQNSSDITNVQDWKQLYDFCDQKIRL